MKLKDNLKRPQLIQSMMQHANSRTAASMLNSAVTTQHVMLKRLVASIVTDMYICEREC